MGLHIHLEPLGGIAGDMFAAAMLDALPEHQAPLLAALNALALPAGVSVGLEPCADGTLTGARFTVGLPAAADHHGHGHDHGHRSFREIRRYLTASPLEPAVRQRALAIFQILAEAEAKVHGVAEDEVHFHEVGAWDSIVDIVSAAFLIERAAARSWSVAPLPLGSGRIKTRHGELPVPPPAVALLLAGFAVIDDGRPGERVTPTGAAILRHLAPAERLPPRALRQQRVGYGFGTKRLEGISNVLCVLVLDELGAEALDEEIGVISFEIDDQTPEDLAIGLDRLRASPGVLDVLQSPAFGKKGRLVMHVQVLTEAAALDAAAERCLLETTTLGVRLGRVRRRVLARDSATLADAEGRPVRVKRATRPGGAVTAKAEMAGIAATAGDARDRSRRRRHVEVAALAEEEDADD